MKLLRLGAFGQEKPAALDADGQYRDLSGHIQDLTPCHMELGELDKLKAIDLNSLPIPPADSRIGCPLSDVPNFHCVGLNYARHADETGMARPDEPILFSKATSALAAPNDDIAIPMGAEKVDWEVELGVVIGKTASHVDEADALDYVAGYCTINDVSERAFQLETGGQWVKGKSAPGLVQWGHGLLRRMRLKTPKISTCGAP